jgi:hypothetical protein
MNLQQLLTVGSVALAIINIGVMWAMAHQWRYAWHSNLALQLLWLPYDYLTSQYGLLGLGTVITFVSLKGAHRENQLAKAREQQGQPSHRRSRRPDVSQPGVPAGAAPGTEVADGAAGHAAVAHAEAGQRAGLTLHSDITVPADTAGLAGVSVSTGPVAADRDGTGPRPVPAVPQIPQQPDRRTALDAQQRTHLP